MIYLKQINPNTGILQRTEDIRTMQLSMPWQIPIAIIRLTLLVAVDTAALHQSWKIAGQIGIEASGSHITDMIVPLLAITIGTLAASGFYGTDDKLNQFAKLFKALTLAQTVILIAAFFYQPGVWWVSRLVFTIAWLLNFVFIGLARSLFYLLKFLWLVK